MTSHASTGDWSEVARQQASVARIGQLGLRGVALDALFGQALTEIGDTLGVANVVLLEMRSDWDQLVGRGARYGGMLIDPELVSHVRVPAGHESMAGFTVLQGIAVTSRDLAEDTRFQVRGGDYGIDARAALTAPVGWGEQPWGVVVIYSEVVRAWTANDVDYAQSMANTMGLAVARTLAELELHDANARLDLSLAAGGMGAWTWDVGNDRVEVSESGLAIYGLGAARFDGSGDSFLSAVHPEDRAILRGDVYEALQTTGEAHNVFRVIREIDGEVRWLESWGRMLEGGNAPLRLGGVVTDITERQLADETREALLAREQRARVEAEQARERLTVLADASRRFSASLDPEVIVASLPGVCVPLLADVCLVDVFGDDGALHEVAAAAHEERSLVQVRALRARRAELGGTGGVWSERAVAGRNESVFEPALTDEQFQAAAADAEHLALFRRLGSRSSIVVPMVARGRVIGVLTLILNTPGRAYTTDHLAMVEELAARAALALDNGRLFESRNRVARSLQAALLPPALPTIAGLQVAARYRVAEADIEIGGDFYDVIEVGPRAWGVVVGDVCGRGPDAAALTGLMRHSVRTAVVREELPSRVLAQTNDAVLDQIDDAKFCTAAYLRVELPDTPAAPVRVIASSAGHPRPAVVRADGSAEFLDCSGLLLGVVAAPTLVDVTLELGPGDAVVLYTDGVTEARHGPELFGEARLLGALRRLAGGDADALAAGLDAEVSAFQDDANDDVAILVVRASPAP